jgi:serine/threonine-protein kinase
LYALGVLLYQALTDLHPFDPELPDKELLAAIATVPPTAPHLLNPLAPRSLSDIAMKLLEKKPEARYPSTEALRQALEKAAESERQSPAWKVPLFPVQGSPAESPPQEEAAPPAPPSETAHATPEETPPLEEEGAQTTEAPREAPGRPRRARWLRVLLVSLTVLGLALWLAHSRLALPPEALLPGSGRSEKGSPPVSTPARSTPSSLLAAWLCAIAGIGCPAAQVRPPEPADCPQDATEAMFQDLKITTISLLAAVVDINQPEGTSEPGVYQDGPVIGRITEGDGNLPVGTLLHGRLWTGPDIYEMTNGEKEPAVLGRYTLAILPDGRKYPVCIVLGDPSDGRVPMLEGSKPGAAMLYRVVPVTPVERWP